MTTNDQYEKLQIDGTDYKTLTTSKFRKQIAWKKPDLRKIHAPIPGTVREFFVKPKQRVKAGEVLFILEAMKMNNRILAPFEGVIRKIFVKKDQGVAKNELILEFE